MGTEEPRVHREPLHHGQAQGQAAAEEGEFDSGLGSWRASSQFWWDFEIEGVHFEHFCKGYGRSYTVILAIIRRNVLHVIPHQLICNENALLDLLFFILAQ